MLLIGLGIGVLASQLGSVTVSAVPDEQSPDVGGVQNTMTNLGASIGTALAGAVLISVLTASFVDNVSGIRPVVARQGPDQTAGRRRAPVLSDKQLEEALDAAHVPPRQSEAIVDANAEARLDGLRAALGPLALVALIGLFFTRLIPTEQPRGPPVAAA